MPDAGWRALLGQAKRSFWLLFGGVWLLAGSILLIVGIGSWIEERRWSEAIRTTGMVLTKDIVPADSDSSTQYRVSFRYADERGETREGGRQVEVATWESLTERGPIDVYVLPGSSEPARLDPDADGLGPLIFLLVGLGGAGFGGVVFGRAVRNLVRAHRLLTRGTDADARVTAVEGTNVTYNQQPQFRVRYTYDVAGVAHAGDSGYLEWEEASAYAEGDTVPIRYDRQRPGESVWLGRPAPPLVTPDAAGPEPADGDAVPPADGAEPIEGSRPA